MKQINIFIEMLSAWLLTVKVVLDKERPTFLYISKGRKPKQKWKQKMKRRNIQSMQHTRRCSLIGLAKISAGKRCDFS